jgi:catechol 2,3-dioxygenase-like lactoylglutathione lyase family enzyme
MYDHVTLRVRDFGASLAFYEAALAPLGIALRTEDGTSAAFGTAPSFLLTSRRTPTTNVHVAFSAPGTTAVDAFHAAAVQNGGTDNGAPGIRGDYAANYYAAFALDPDGNNIEAVHHGPARRSAPSVVVTP